MATEGSHLDSTVAAARSISASGQFGEDAWTMARILVVANQTLGCHGLVEALSARLDVTPDAQVVLVAPASVHEGRHQWDYPVSDRNIPDPLQIGHDLALARIEKELRRLGDLGVPAQGEVVDEDPIDRVREVVSQSPVAAVLVCTLPERASHWLRLDLPQRLSRALDVPVIHVRGSLGPPPE